MKEKILIGQGTVMDIHAVHIDVDKCHKCKKYYFEQLVNPIVFASEREYIKGIKS